MAAVVRARITAAKCVQQAVAAARAELAQLAADADAAQKGLAVAAGSDLPEVASPMQSPSETDIEREDAGAPSRQPAISSDEEDVPEPPSSSGEGSEVCHHAALPHTWLFTGHYSIPRACLGEADRGRGGDCSEEEEALGRVAAGRREEHQAEAASKEEESAGAESA